LGAWEKSRDLKVKSYALRFALHTELFFLNRRGRRERREEEKREEMFQNLIVVRNASRHQTRIK
jgi:hypothetical protein